MPRAAVGAPSWKFAMTKEAVDALAERKNSPSVIQTKNATI